MVWYSHANGTTAYSTVSLHFERCWGHLFIIHKSSVYIVMATKKQSCLTTHKIVPKSKQSKFIYLNKDMRCTRRLDLAWKIIQTHRRLSPRTSYTHKSSSHFVSVFLIRICIWPFLIYCSIINAVSFLLLLCRSIGERTTLRVQCNDERTA